MQKEMTGAEMVIQALVDQGVEHIFGYPGGAVLPIYDALFQQQKLQHILVRHEQGAVHAAEGYARSTGKVGAVLVSNDAFFLSQRVQLVALAKRHSLPASYEWREFPAVGGLMSYGPSLPGTFQKVGTYAARILKGAQPSDLPIEQPTEFNLVINSATARSLGIHIPPTLLARADEVIE